MREIDIEQKLLTAVKAYGGVCWKFTSPGTAGVPDRIVLMPHGRIAFVEVKTRLNENYGKPREAVGGDKQRRYRKIAEYYWLRTGEEPNARFDVAEVFDGKIEYYKNAY
jgi:Holliday junction resolvase-like predicted endonuclease